MNHYHVEWQIDIYAATPEAAAREALKIQRDAGSMATVFEVRLADDDEVITVDIEQLDLGEISE